jgi:hypothetical protein
MLITSAESLHELESRLFTALWIKCESGKYHSIIGVKSFEIKEVD